MRRIKKDRTNAERQRRWYWNNREKKIKQVKRWQEVNRERYLKKQREYNRTVRVTGAND